MRSTDTFPGSVSGTVRRQTISFLERALAITGLVVSSGMVVAPTADSPPDRFVSLVVWPVIYGLSLLFILRHFRVVVSIVRSDPYTPALVGLAIASGLWAALPESALRLSVGLLGTTAFGIYLGLRFRPEELFRVLIWAFTVVLVTNALVAMTMPERGIHMGEAWRGAYSHKNGLGRMMVLSTIVWTLCFSENKNRLVTVFLWVSSVTLLVLSRSATSLLLFGLMLLVLVLSKGMRISVRVALPLVAWGLVILVGVGVYIQSRVGLIIQLLGKDATLTGRTVLWELVWDAIWNRPWLGYGYGSFWVENGPADSVWQFMVWQAPHAHNGFLDLFLQLGAVGVVLFGVSYLRNLARCFKRYRLHADNMARFSFVFFLFLMATNLTESNLVVPKTTFWILYVALPVALSSHSPKR